MDVGIVGLGAIGRALCRALDDGIPGLRLAGATAREREKAERFLKGLRSPAPFLALDDLIGASSLVVEASSQAHLQEIAPKTLTAVVFSCRRRRSRGSTASRARASARSPRSRWRRESRRAGSQERRGSSSRRS